MRRYAYDAEGRLAAVSVGDIETGATTRYLHNVLGQRVFKTEPIYGAGTGGAAEPSTWQSVLAFFSGQGASVATGQLGTAYVYDEEGSLLLEAGMGGAQSDARTQHVYLPTAGGPLPIAAVVHGERYAVSSDHLNTPRRITNSDGQVVWQWAYSAFGENEPTTVRHRFAEADKQATAGTTSFAPFDYGKRHDGMLADAESGLRYNVRRSYDPRSGRYIQVDPIGLEGGFSRDTFAFGNPLRYSDPYGLFVLLPPIAMPPGVPTPAMGGAPPSIDPKSVRARRGSPVRLAGPLVYAAGRSQGRGQRCKALADWMFSEKSASQSTVQPEFAESCGASPSRDAKRTKWVEPINPRRGDYVESETRNTNASPLKRWACLLDSNGNQIWPSFTGSARTAPPVAVLTLSLHMAV